MKNQKTTTTITRNELKELLFTVEKSEFVNLVTSTKERMNKTNNPYFDKVIKLSKRNYLSGNNYQDRVRSNQIKEGLEPDFVSEENKVGTHVSKCVLFNDNTNSFYFEVEPFDEIKPKVEYIFEGNQIDQMLFNDYRVKKSKSSRQPQQKKVNVLSFKLDSIKELSLRGQHYVVTE
jgi:hypothetical protein